jgi:hypothetical protein
MAMFNITPNGAQVLIQQAVLALTQFRNGINAVEDAYKWSSGVSEADLMAQPPDGLGMSQANADALLSALADAHAVAEYFNTGLPPGTYPQPPSGYVYGASVRRVIGPRAQ